MSDEKLSQPDSAPSRSPGMTTTTTAADTATAAPTATGDGAAATMTSDSNSGMMAHISQKAETSRDNGPSKPPPVSTAVANPPRMASSPADPRLSGSTDTLTAATSPAATSPAVSIEINKTKPEDFDGEVATDDSLPTLETLRRIQDYVVLDRHGKSHAFKSLYSGRNVARRMLIIFVRHFFCGNCQEYLRHLSESITPESLLALPVSTFIAVVGCGDPGLIDMYVTETGCPFPVYTDPTRSLFGALGMVRTLQLGPRPAYARRSFANIVVDGIVQGLRHLPAGLATRGGDQRQVGGELLFEPPTVSTPFEEDGPGARAEQQRGEESKGQRRKQRRRPGEGEDDDDVDEPVATWEEKRVTWCHRMRTTRDHAEVPELMEILGLDGSGRPIKDKKRWSRALEMRKGTGLTMAGEMNRMGEAAQIARSSLSSSPSSPQTEAKGGGGGGAAGVQQMRPQEGAACG